MVVGRKPQTTDHELHHLHQYCISLDSANVLGPNVAASYRFVQCVSKTHDPINSFICTKVFETYFSSKISKNNI